MENQNEMVVVEKAVLDELLSTVKALKKQLDDMEATLNEANGYIAELASRHNV